jgi:hypothetical protein
MDDTTANDNVSTPRKPYVPPTLADLDSVPDTRGKATSFSEVATSAGIAS